MNMPLDLNPYNSPLSILINEMEDEGGDCAAQWAGENTTAHDVFYAIGDQPPTDEQFVLALTPHVDEAASWREREREALRVNEEQAMQAHWEFFVEKTVKYENDGDVIWA